MVITFATYKEGDTYISYADLIEASTHQGMRGYGNTEAEAIKNLIDAWNEKVSEDTRHLKKLENLKGVIVKESKFVIGEEV